MRVLRLLWAALREIFDEAPYDRFLARQKHQRSPETYWRFLQERRSTQERKARCC